MYIYFLLPVVPLLWSLVNYSDKFLLGRTSSRDSYGVGTLILYSSLFGLLAAPIIAIFNPSVFSIERFEIILLIGAGILQSVWVYFYLLALEGDEVSNIVPFFQTTPLFAYGWAFLFLGETLSLEKIGAGVIILLGSLLLSTEFHFATKKFHIKTRTLFLGFGFSIIYTLIPTIFKFSAIEHGFWDAAFWRYAGLGISGLVIFACNKKYRRAFLGNVKSDGTFMLGFNVSSELLTAAGDMILAFATLSIPIFTAELLTNGIQPFIALLLGIVLTLLFPHIIKEEISTKHLAQKIISIIIIGIGSILFFWN